MDVKYKENEWDKSKDALKTLIGLGWGKGVTDHLKDINTNFEDAQNDIRKDDPDGAISFSFTDRESKYQTMFEKIEVLHDYAGEAGSMVERVIDEPFYKDIDKFVEKMEALSIEDYETKNTIGATTIVTTSYGYGYGATPQTTTVPKDKINLSDIMAGDNFFADNLKAQFAEYSKQNPDQEFTYEQYQSAVSSSRAFEYESIRDEQQSREFWRDIGIAVVIIGVSILCPPAGLALGVAYGTLELSSAATGKDWMTGREMDGTERATRGAFALLDIIPGVKGIRAFSTATKAGGLALDAAQVSSKLTLRQTAKQGLSHVDAMGRQALRESAERIRNVPRVISDVASSAKNTMQEGLTAAKKMTANFGDNMRSLNFGGERLVADGFGTVGAGVAKNADSAGSSTSKIVGSWEEAVPTVKEVKPRKLTPAEKKLYKRPSGYRKGVRDSAWESAKDSTDGLVKDPLTGKVMDKSEPWDMGHKPGYEFRKHQQSAAERGISRKEFLDEHNVSEHYWPELPSSNQSHAGEDITDLYFGP